MGEAFRSGPLQSFQGTPHSLFFVCWMDTEEFAEDCRLHGQSHRLQGLELPNDFVKGLLPNRNNHFVLCISQKKMFIVLSQGELEV